MKGDESSLPLSGDNPETVLIATWYRFTEFFLASVAYAYYEFLSNIILLAILSNWLRQGRALRGLLWKSSIRLGILGQACDWCDSLTACEFGDHSVGKSRPIHEFTRRERITESQDCPRFR